MTRQLAGWALRFLSVLIAFILAIGAVMALRNLDLLSPFGIRSDSHDSQVIRAVQRTQEVSLLSLGIQGIREKHQSRTFLGRSIPGTGKKVFVQYRFHAKLGIDGAHVRVTKTGKRAYLVSVPRFRFIGYDHLAFKVAAADNGMLSWVTPDVDQLKLVNVILGPRSRGTYLASNKDALEEQTKLFYSRLITSIDPAATTRFEFDS